MAAPTNQRRARLRAVAEQHGWELAGFSGVFWPKTAAKLALLAQAWAEIEADAAAGKLTGDELRQCNYRPGWRPRGWWAFTRPDLVRPDDDEAMAALLHAEGEIVKETAGPVPPKTR
jgi:hypothetical protein